MIIQARNIVHYDTIMGFGFAARKLEFDFSNSSSNEAKFTLTVIQDDVHETVRAEIIFETDFETEMAWMK